MDSNMLLYAVSEVAVLLLCICIYLLFHLKSLKKLVAQLEEKILTLRETITATKKKAQSLIAEARDAGVSTYVDFIETQLSNTRDYHQMQSPDRDIVLDLDVEVELERQVAALRNAFLVSEKEASYAGDEDNPSWDVLKAKLEQLINFYQHAFNSDSVVGEGAGEVDEAALAQLQTELEQLQEELNNYKKRVGNLEKFKKLFFDMEGKWSAAKAEADDYYQQLKARAKELDAGEDFDQLLESYANSYSSLDLSFEDGRIIEGGGGSDSESRDVEGGERPVRTEKVYIKNQDEVDRLRDMMANQHGIIAQLKQKLRDSSKEERTEEEKDSLLDEMSEQLDKQERFLKESETCIQLLEDELDGAQAQIKELGDALAKFQGEIAGAASGGEAAQEGEKAASGDGPSEKEIEELVAGYITESRDMLNTISLLEQENQQLKEQLENGDFAGDSSSSGSSDDAEELRTKLSEVQQELLNIQTQHIELEERYIELKTSTM